MCINWKLIVQTKHCIILLISAWNVLKLIKFHPDVTYINYGHTGCIRDEIWLWWKLIFRRDNTIYNSVSLHTYPQPPWLPGVAGLFQCSWRPPAVSLPSAAAQCGQCSDACLLRCTPLGWNGDMLPPRSANLSTVGEGGWEDEYQNKKNN